MTIAAFGLCAAAAGLILPGFAGALADGDEIEPSTPPAAFVRTARNLQDKAHKALEDKEFEDVTSLTAALAELAQLQTMRDNADYQKWARAVAGSAARASAAASKEQEAAAKAEIANLAKLVEDATAKADGWNSAKAVRGKYTPVNKDTKHLMVIVSEADRLTKKALQKDGANLAPLADGHWLSADIGSVMIIQKAEPEWKQIAAKHRDLSLGLAKLLSGSDREKAKEGYGNLQINCKACHDKFQ
jgi:hypothetical protein